jgi:hypothetical protein
MVVTNKPLELGMWNLVWKYIIHIPTNFLINIICNKLKLQAIEKLRPPPGFNPVTSTQKSSMSAPELIRIILVK